jgi:hypothetical protein
MFRWDCAAESLGLGWEGLLGWGRVVVLMERGGCSVLIVLRVCEECGCAAELGEEVGVVEARVGELGTEYHVVDSTRCGIVYSLRSTCGG